MTILRDYVIGPILMLLALSIFIFVPIGTFFGGFDYLDCVGFERGTGIETRWYFGCYAKVNGEWIPKDYVYGKVNEVRLKSGQKK